MEYQELSIHHYITYTTDTPISPFYPTHINRSNEQPKQGIELAKAGGFINFTTSTNE